jgi:YVTN family beta-propeller protein
MVYVSNDSGFVTPIDSTTNRPGTSDPVPSRPYSIAITPDGKTLLVAQNNTDTVTPIDTSSNTVGTPITVGNNPIGIAVSPDGTTAYVANSSDKTVSVIDLATLSVVATITVGGAPEHLAVTPDGSTVYVTTSGTGVVPFSTATHRVGRTIHLPGTGVHANAIAITPDGRTAFVSDSFNERVYPITLSTGTVGAAITSGISQSWAIVISPDGLTAYVVNYQGTVTPVSVATDVPGTPIAVGPQAFAAALTPDGATLYVANSGNGTVSPITTATGAVGAPITVGGQPSGVAIVPAPSLLPPTPTGTKAVALGRTITVTWNASTGATGYLVYRATSPTRPFRSVAAVTGTSFVNTRLRTSTTYYYEVKAQNGIGTSAPSVVASATT